MKLSSGLSSTYGIILVTYILALITPLVNCDIVIGQSTAGTTPPTKPSASAAAYLGKGLPDTVTNGPKQEGAYPLDDTCHADFHAGYDGHAFTWGMAFRAADAGECCAACKAHAAVCGDDALTEHTAHTKLFFHVSGEKGPTSCGQGSGHVVKKEGAEGVERMACNVWVFCPEELCWSNDIHNHTKGECWLKHQPTPSNPKSPSRGKYPARHRAEHTTAPEFVQWMSGALVPKGVKVVPGDPSWGKSEYRK